MKESERRERTVAESEGKIRALIVDDEPFARERVRRLVASEADIEVVGESKNGFEAVSAIRELAPDLLFLDVQMPGRDGFGVLEDLAPEETPVVIFLTAYDQYAVRAFEAAALDYVLKPFDEERFKKAVARARTQLARLKSEVGGATATSEVQTEATESLGGAAPYLDRIIIRSEGRVLFRRADEIDWVEAYGNYVRLHIERAAYLLRETIGNLEARLDPRKFVRIHRSTLVQIDRIREIRPLMTGQSKVVLRDGTQLTLSRRYRRLLPASFAEAF
jgi:two-component system LytT family response regulator